MSEDESLLPSLCPIRRGGWDRGTSIPLGEYFFFSRDRLSPAAPGARNATGSASTVADGQPPAVTDPILSDPNEAYRTEVLQALKDAMLAELIKRFAALARVPQHLASR